MKTESEEGNREENILVLKITGSWMRMENGDRKQREIK
jgi:hypothetical protein